MWCCPRRARARAVVLWLGGGLRVGIDQDHRGRGGRQRGRYTAEVVLPTPPLTLTTPIRTRVG